MFRVWRLGSDIITPCRYVYTAVNWGVINRTS